MRLKNLLAVAFLVLGIGGVVALALLFANILQSPQGSKRAEKKAPPVWQPPIMPAPIEKPVKPTEPVLVVHSPFPKMPSPEELLRRRKERLAAAMKYEEKILNGPREESETGAFLFYLNPVEEFTNGFFAGMTYSFSPDGRLLLGHLHSGGVLADPSVRVLWDIVKKKTIGELEESRRKSVFRETFSPDGKMVAALVAEKGKSATEIFIWSSKNGKKIQTIIPTGLFFASHPVFTPDSSLLAANCYESASQIRWWDIKTGKELARLKMPESCNEFAFSVDGRRLATASGTAVHLWSFPACKLLNSFPCIKPRTLKFSPSGKYLALASDERLHVIDLTSKTIKHMKTTGALSYIDFIADEDMIAINFQGLGAAPILFVKTDSLKEVTSFGYNALTDFCLSPNGRVMVVSELGDKFAAYDVGKVFATKDLNLANRLVRGQLGGNWRIWLSRKGKYLEVDLSGKQGFPFADARNIDLAKAATLPWVRRLFLGGNISDFGLEVLPKFKHLREISFEKLPRITNAGLAHVKSLTNVEKLTLSELDRVNDDGLAHLKALPKLEHLTIRSMPHLTEKGIAHLQLCPALRRLEMQNCELNEASLVQLRKVKQLQDMKFDKKIDDKTLSYLAESLNQRELRLVGSNVTDAGLKYVGKMSGLKVLDLTNLPITDRGLAEIENLGQLETLRLGGTKVKTLGAIKKLVKLKRIDLSATDISDAAFANLAGLPNLEIVYVFFGTKLRGSGLLHLKTCPKLKELDLSLVEINDDGFRHVSALRQLRSLRIPRRITDNGLKHISELSDLHHLQLGDRITDAGLPHLHKLKELKSLYLWVTRVTDKGLIHLKDLKKITKLHITSAKMNGSGLIHLRDMPLEELNLSGSKIEDFSLAHIAKIKSLRKLDLERTNISDAGLKHLRKMTHLRVVLLGGTRVTENGAINLRLALPNAIVRSAPL